MCQWLIAMYGKHFADTDNINVVMEMLKNVVITHEIGGFTAETLPEFLKGKHMEMITFTNSSFVQSVCSFPLSPLSPLPPLPPRSPFHALSSTGRRP
jgi:hypothetical protein